ncbi:copper resistance protein CopC [Leucobacter sp. CSA2]|uniref:Copper resistance protein CopC n=1 Tax=Leucobacter edaphi TaxID=2796472 RepID=A0A934QA08_9MICO|nr:copper resistance CopC family protein [Leucobacter edaphi]MBK0420915.1 copper resistance protein CopC [Leucobacter edaphi]
MTSTIRTRIAALAVAFGVAFAALLTFASPAQAHDSLVNTVLGADDAGKTDSFTLTFSNSIIEVGTEIVVKGPGGKALSVDKPKVAGPDVTQSLGKDLAAGEYSAAWRVVSSDGHPIEGTFGITIDDSGKGVLSKTAPAPEHEHAEGHEGEGDHATEPAGHSHAEGEQHSDGAGGMNPGVLTAVIIGAAVVVIGGVTAAVVGTRRRKSAMDEAIGGGNAAKSASEPRDGTPQDSTQGE